MEAQETPDWLLLPAPGVGEDDVLDVKAAGRNGSDFSGATARWPIWVSGTSAGMMIRRGNKSRRQALRRRLGRRLSLAGAKAFFKWIFILTKGGMATVRPNVSSAFRKIQLNRR